VPGLAAMLGANVGTTLIVQVLSFDISRVAPLFILIGVMMFRRGGVTRTRDLGRVGIGLGLILIALTQLLSILTPYEDVPSLRLLLGMIATAPVIDVIVGAAITWAAHSSVAVVLLTMSFAAQGVAPPQAAFALVLGANLGTALNPLFEAGSTGDPAAKRLLIGNLLNRAVGCRRSSPSSPISNMPAISSNGGWRRTWQSGPSAISLSRPKGPPRSTRCSAASRRMCARRRRCS